MKAPANWPSRYLCTSSHCVTSVSAKPIVTAGLMCAPLICPTAYTAIATAIPHPNVITIQPAFSAFERASRTPATTPSPNKISIPVPISSAVKISMTPPSGVYCARNISHPDGDVNVYRARSDARDVHGVAIAKRARDVVLAADEEQLVRVGVLCPEALFPGEDPSPQRDAAEGDGASLPDRGQLSILAPVALPNAGVAPKEILRERARPERVDAAFVVVDGGGVPMERAACLESPHGRPAHVVPGEGFEPVLIAVEPDVPKPPPDDWLGRELTHAGAGSSTGSTTGAGAGTGSSNGVISISRSVSGTPMSIADDYPDRNGDSASGLADESSCPSFSVGDAEDLKQTLDRGADRHVGERAGRDHTRAAPTLGGDGAEASAQRAWRRVGVREFPSRVEIQTRDATRHS